MFTWVRGRQVHIIKNTLPILDIMYNVLIN